MFGWVRSLGDFWVAAWEGWAMTRSSLWAAFQTILMLATLLGIGVVPWLFDTTRNRTVSLALVVSVGVAGFATSALCLMAYIGQHAITERAYEKANTLRDVIDEMNRKQKGEERASS